MSEIIDIVSTTMKYPFELRMCDRPGYAPMTHHLSTLNTVVQRWVRGCSATSNAVLLDPVIMVQLIGMGTITGLCPSAISALRKLRELAPDISTTVSQR